MSVLIEIQMNERGTFTWFVKCGTKFIKHELSTTKMSTVTMFKILQRLNSLAVDNMDKKKATC